jgi:hypothetical protein
MAAIPTFFPTHIHPSSRKNSSVRDSRLSNRAFISYDADAIRAKIADAGSRRLS